MRLKTLSILPVRRPTTASRLARSLLPPSNHGRRCAHNDPPITTEPPRDIAVLGGGWTGLITAFHLLRNIPDAQITIYEASVHNLGGWIDSLTQKAPTGKIITLEHGPRLVKVPAIMKDTTYDSLAFFATFLDGPSGEPLPQPRGGVGIEGLDDNGLAKYIYVDGNMIQIDNPAQSLTRITAPRDGNLLGSELLKFLFYPNQEPLGPKTGGANNPYWDLSIADAIERALGPGQSALLRSASTGLSGIYGCGPEDISIRHAGSMIPAKYAQYVNFRERFPLSLFQNQSYRSLADWNFVRRTNHNVPVNYSAQKGVSLFSRHGLGEWVKVLVDFLRKSKKVTFEMASTILSIDYDKETSTISLRKASSLLHGSSKQILGETITRHDKVISTLFSGDLAHISKPPLKALEETRASSISLVTLWYPQENLNPLTDSFGFLIPASTLNTDQNPEQALGVIFDTNINPPQQQIEGGTKFTVMLGGYAHWKDISPDTRLPDEAAIEAAKRVLHRSLGIPMNLEAVVSTKFCGNCIPIPLVGHRGRMARAHEELNEAFGGKLMVAGPSYTRPGVLGAARAGMDAATALTRGHRGVSQEPSAWGEIGETGLGGFVGYEEMVRTDFKDLERVFRVRDWVSFKSFKG